jgi:hypothetical protein
MKMMMKKKNYLFRPPAFRFTLITFSHPYSCLSVSCACPSESLFHINFRISLLPKSASECEMDMQQQHMHRREMGEKDKKHGMSRKWISGHVPLMANDFTSF